MQTSDIQTDTVHDMQRPPDILALMAHASRNSRTHGLFHSLPPVLLYTTLSTDEALMHRIERLMPSSGEVASTHCEPSAGVECEK